MSMLKIILRSLTPFGLVEIRRQFISHRKKILPKGLRPVFHSKRHLYNDSVKHIKTLGSIQGDDYEQVITYLKGRGLPEHHLREGSMPLKSLEFIREQVISKLEEIVPIKALHIGNFVGVSLAFLTASLVKRHPESLVVSIDPNIPHRGILNPQIHVSALLSICGIQRNSLIVTGYSGHKSISNDGVLFDGYDPQKEYSEEYACEEVLNNMCQISPKMFDIIFLDGNHDATYLSNEIKQVLPILKKGGFVVLDDVDDYWVEIRDVFLKVSSLGLTPLYTDGRVGIAQLK